MGLSETVIAAMIGAAATMVTAIFQLTMSLRSRSKEYSKPKKGSGMRTLFAVFAIILASAVGGFAYSELRAERVREDIRGLRSELDEKLQAIAGVRAGQVLGVPGSLSNALTLASAHLPDAGSSESIVRVAPCRARPAAFGNTPLGCDVDDANRVTLCASLPSEAVVREVRLFAHPLDVEQTWDQSRVEFEQDIAGARFTDAPFEPPSARAPAGTVAATDAKSVCVNFSQWNSERGHAARLVVLYGPPAETASVRATVAAQP